MTDLTIAIRILITECKKHRKCKDCPLYLEKEIYDFSTCSLRTLPRMNNIENLLEKLERD